MIEWKFNMIIAKNPELMRVFENSNHPLTKKYNYIENNEDGNEQ